MQTVSFPSVDIRPPFHDELAFISILEASYFKESSLNAKGLLEWWNAYPDGIKIMTIDNKPAGGIGIWPVRKCSFMNLIKGAIEETEIPYEDIITKEECLKVPQSYWYWGSIFLLPDYQNKGLSKVLVHKTMAEWLMKDNLAESVNLCAIAYSKEGARILGKLKFDCCCQSKSKHPIYCRKTSRLQMKAELLNKLDKKKT